MTKEQAINTPKPEIRYGYICEQLPTTNMFFRTYEEAEHLAKIDQPAYRPFYIIKAITTYEIVGKVEE